MCNEYSKNNLISVYVRFENRTSDNVKKPSIFNLLPLSMHVTSFANDTSQPVKTWEHLIRNIFHNRFRQLRTALFAINYFAADAALSQKT